MPEYFDGWFRPTDMKPLPAVASKRTLTTAICEALLSRYTRSELEWRREDLQPSQAETKRALITGYIDDWSLAELAAFARRLSTYPGHLPTSPRSNWPRR